MNAAIDKNTFTKSNDENYLDLPGIVQVFHHPTFVKVINDLKAPKIHTNEFGGGYNYRSAEDIQAALKPVLLKHKCSVIMRKFDIDDGFEIYAYIIFKDQTYIRCELPGVANYDFDRDLGNNKKISKTQQYAAYQSYAKKYALSNLLMIDDSQNDLDTFTNNNIQNESQRNNKQRYQNQPVNNGVTQADCDRALKQINELPLNTPLQQATFFFDGIRSQLPEFEEVLYEACKHKYQLLEQFIADQQNQQKTVDGSISAVNQNNHPDNTAVNNSQMKVEQQNKASSTNNKAKPSFITDKQRDELQNFIDVRGLDIKTVCEHLGIDALTQIQSSTLEAVKNDIDKLAHEGIHA